MSRPLYGVAIARRRELLGLSKRALAGRVLIGKISTMRWYFCIRALPVIVVRTWDAASSSYV